jgi:hypothetical protein
LVRGRITEALNVADHLTGNFGAYPNSCPIPATTGVQNILMNDFANEHVNDSFFFTYCHIKFKGKQMVNSKY